MNKSIILDYDGTLVNSNPVWREFLVCLCNKYDKPCSNEIIDKVDGKNIPMGEKYNMLGFNWQKQQDLIWEEFTKYFLANPAPMFSGIKDSLREIRKTKVKIAIATLNTFPLIRNFLEINGLEDVFDSILTKEDSGTKKQLLKMAAIQLGVPTPACISIGDTSNDFKSAKELSMIPIVAGYGGVEYSPELPKMAGPRRYIKQPEDFGRIVLENII